MVEGSRIANAETVRMVRPAEIKMAPAKHHAAGKDAEHKSRKLRQETGAVNRPSKMGSPERLPIHVIVFCRSDRSGQLAATTARLAMTPTRWAR